MIKSDALHLTFTHYITRCTDMHSYKKMLPPIHAHVLKIVLQTVNHVLKACSQSSHFYAAVGRNRLALISPSLPFWSSLAISGKGDKPRFCFECRIIQVSAISQPPAFKTQVFFSPGFFGRHFGVLNLESFYRIWKDTLSTTALTDSSIQHGHWSHLLWHSRTAWSRCKRCGCIGPHASGGPAPWCLDGCSLNLIVSKQCSRWNEHWHKRWKVKLVDADLLFESEDSNSWSFNHSRRKCYFAFFAWSVLDTEPCQPVWAVGQDVE